MDLITALDDADKLSSADLSRLLKGIEDDKINDQQLTLMLSDGQIHSEELDLAFITYAKDNHDGNIKPEQFDELTEAVNNGNITSDDLTKLLEAVENNNIESADLTKLLDGTEITASELEAMLPTESEDDGDTEEDEDSSADDETESDDGTDGASASDDADDQTDGDGDDVDGDWFEFSDWGMMEFGMIGVVVVLILLFFFCKGNDTAPHNEPATGVQWLQDWEDPENAASRWQNRYHGGRRLIQTPFSKLAGELVIEDTTQSAQTETIVTDEKYHHTPSIRECIADKDLVWVVPLVLLEKLFCIYVVYKLYRKCKRKRTDTIKIAPKSAITMSYDIDVIINP